MVIIKNMHCNCKLSYMLANQMIILEADFWNRFPNYYFLVIILVFHKEEVVNTKYSNLISIVKLTRD